MGPIAPCYPRLRTSSAPIPGCNQAVLALSFVLLSEITQWLSFFAFPANFRIYAQRELVRSWRRCINRTHFKKVSHASRQIHLTKTIHLCGLAHAAPPSITFSQSERLKSTIGVGTDILKHIIGPSIFVSAGGAISFKSVLSDAQQFYWMNNLCSQSERSCWYCLYSLGEY